MIVYRRVWPLLLALRQPRRVDPARATVVAGVHDAYYGEVRRCTEHNDAGERDAVVPEAGPRADGLFASAHPDQRRENEPDEAVCEPPHEGYHVSKIGHPLHDGEDEAHHR